MPHAQAHIRNPSLALMAGIYGSTQDATASHMHREYFKFVLVKTAAARSRAGMLERKGMSPGCD
jgi:hypothetical protein